MLGPQPPSHAAHQLIRESRGNRGFTLVELLIASTIGLILMGSLATLLGLFSRTSSSAQAIVSMTHAMRTVGSRLRSDLAGVTVEMSPPVKPESDSGYFELIEGPRSDSYDWVSRGGASAEKKPINAVISGPTAATSDLGSDGLQSPLDPVGDIDDALLFTTRSAAKPFTGRFGSGTIDSSAIEVAWFLKRSSAQPIAGVTVYDLYRKQLLVLAYAGVEPFLSGTSVLSLTGTVMLTGTAPVFPNSVRLSGTVPSFPFRDFYRHYDISVRSGQTLFLGSESPPLQLTILHPNTLSDLTKRENRFNRRVVWPFNEVFPFAFQRTNEPQATFDDTAREGEDIVLRNVLAFDVRVFDPSAPMKQIRNVSVPGGPGDIGYAETDSSPYTPDARGTYADLGWGAEPPTNPPIISSPSLHTRLYRYPINPAGSPAAFDNRFPGWEDTDLNGMRDSGERELSPFQGYGMQLVSGTISYAANSDWSNLTNFPSPLSYDTWSSHYESNGINEDGDFEPDGITPLVDEGTNGADDNGDGIPDDPAERETSPPYPVPLRGIEVRIRCIEPNTKEIRQITIRHAFQ
jgi:prepilin-type N-terminal cleavage/methylation domain-containing protein